MKQVDWLHIRQAWVEGIESLIKLANFYGITIQDITLKAQSESWPDRGFTPSGSASSSIRFDEPVLDDKQVILAHKTDLGRMRLLAACIIEGMRDESDHKVILAKTEKLMKIYSQLIPLERVTFGLDSNSGDSPDAIIITRRK